LADTRHTTRTDDAPEVLTAPEARQARPGRPVLVILIASLAIAALALMVLMSWQRSEMPDSRPQVERSNTPATPPAR
jgi:flagellar basal body-associated protein FliL